MSSLRATGVRRYSAGTGADAFGVAIEAVAGCTWLPRLLL